MDPEEMAQKALSNLLNRAGIVKDNFGQDNDMARSFRDEILESLTGHKAFQSLGDRRLLTIHAWNRRMAAMFFEGQQMVVTYQVPSDQPWKLAGIDTFEGDIYDLQASFPVAKQVNGIIKEPKLFVYIDREGNETACHKRTTTKGVRDARATPSGSKQADLSFVRLQEENRLLKVRIAKLEKHLAITESKLQQQQTRVTDFTIEFLSPQVPRRDRPGLAQLIERYTDMNGHRVAQMFREWGQQSSNHPVQLDLRASRDVADALCADMQRATSVRLRVVPFAAS